ncbi:YARHG domain-containing protein [Olleya sp. Bg11-27]|uniref:YARHG domain-containing protein n=1 Tax=Olleya sp. Bg11-27 TaxID=2058135 RepID=UPI000C3015CE|nr:YARHG domain-containing protein [Olleya sp. Bg11-27]AUC76031.1 hypothetical protein CW732_10310 [Olleya sp. Bg11-27]
MKYIVTLILILCSFSCKENEQRINISSIKFLDDTELKTKSIKDLRIIRNEVFARKGYIFKNRDLNDHFFSKNWYIPNRNAKITLSTLEQNYVEKIKTLEKTIQLNDPWIKKDGVWNTFGYNDDSIFQVISIDENNNFSMRVTFNQMDLKGKLQKTNEYNKYHLIYEVADIGRGPTYLDWLEFDKDSAVAIFRVIDSVNADIKWLGFYNKKTKDRDWYNNIDYQGKLIKKE